MIEETSHKRTKLSSLCFVLKGQLKYQNWKKKKKKSRIWKTLIGYHVGKMCTK